jgi:hypothetical protein
MFTELDIRIPQPLSSALVPYLLKFEDTLAYWDASFKVDRRLINLMETPVDFLVNHLQDLDFDKLDFAYTSVSEFNPVKEFDPIALVMARFPFDYQDQETGLSLSKGDPYLGVHLSTSSVLPVRAAHMRAGFRKASRFIYLHRDKLPDQPVVGVTYPKLINYSRIYGFTRTDTPVSEEFVNLFKNRVKSDQIVLDRVTQGGLGVCFQSYDDLIQRFPQDPENRPILYQPDCIKKVAS